jgi:hypothetical protein
LAISTPICRYPAAITAADAETALHTRTHRSSNADVTNGRFRSDDSVAFWVEADGTVVIEDPTDLARGGNPTLDLRLAEAHRGHGLGHRCCESSLAWCSVAGPA